MIIVNYVYYQDVIKILFQPLPPEREEAEMGRSIAHLKIEELKSGRVLNEPIVEKGIEPIVEKTGLNVPIVEKGRYSKTYGSKSTP